MKTQEGSDMDVSGVSQERGPYGHTPRNAYSTTGRGMFLKKNGLPFLPSKLFYHTTNQIRTEESK